MVSCYPNDYTASLSASDVSPFHFSTGRCLRPQLYAAAETEAVSPNCQVDLKMFFLILPGLNGHI